MTKDQVIAMAVEARLCGDPKDLAPLEIEILTRFAQLVRDAALEEAAQECTAIATKPFNVILGVAIECADVIRDMKEQT